MLDRERLDGISRRQAIGETGTHHARKDRHSNPLLQIEFLDGLLLLRGRHGALFVDTGQTRSRDAQQTNENTQENYSARGGPDHLGHEFTAENRRDQRSEGCAQAQHHGHPQRQTQVTHSQAKGETTDSPEKPKEKSPENNRPWSFVKYRQEIPSHQQRKKPGSNDPTEKTAREPERLPCPLLHSTVRYVKAAGSQTAEPVVQHAY